MYRRRDGYHASWAGAEDAGQPDGKGRVARALSSRRTGASKQSRQVQWVNPRSGRGSGCRTDRQAPPCRHPPGRRRFGAPGHGSAREPRLRRGPGARNHPPGTTPPRPPPRRRASSRERGGSGGVPTPKPAPHLPETRALTGPAPSRPPSADTGRPGCSSPPG